jgi:hypothetical protein
MTRTKLSLSFDAWGHTWPRTGVCGWVCSSSVIESVYKMSVTFSFNVFLSNEPKKKKRNLNCFTFNSWIKYKNARVNFDHF